MSTETVLKSLIAPLVAGGCHNGVNAANSITLPYVVFYEIASTPQYGISGYLGATSSKYQVDVFAITPEQAKALALGTIKTAIETGSLAGTLTFHMRGEYSDSDGAHQYITEYQLWTP